MSDVTKKPLGRPRSTQSHRAILQAILELLAEVGFERMTIDAIATRAGLAKPRSIGAITQKLSLLQTQLKALEEVVIPDTGTIWGDVDALIQNAALLTLSPLGRQTVAMIISASSNPQFAQIYWTKYLQPRRQAFAVVIERAKTRNEIQASLDPALVLTR